MTNPVAEAIFGRQFQDKIFAGKVGLVTGAGQGIGQATAFRLAAQGASVGVLDLNEGRALETVKEIREAGARAIELFADVADTKAVQEAVDKSCRELGPVEILVNNAGFDRPGGFLKVSADDFRAVWGVHLLGAVNCCHACAPVMMERGDGRIVNISSIYAKTGSKGESAYCSVKAGLIGLTKSLAKEWGAKGIRVNAILPGLTDTPTIRQFMAPQFKQQMIAETPIGRMADPWEIAAAIAFLASDEASFITGAVLEVTGGWNM